MRAVIVRSLRVPSALPVAVWTPRVLSWCPQHQVTPTPARPQQDWAPAWCQALFTGRCMILGPSVPSVLCSWLGNGIASGCQALPCQAIGEPWSCACWHSRALTVTPKGLECSANFQRGNSRIGYKSAASVASGFPARLRPCWNDQNLIFTLSDKIQSFYTSFSVGTHIFL